jgi:hypothetical protein
MPEVPGAASSGELIPDFSHKTTWLPEDFSARDAGVI